MSYFSRYDKGDWTALCDVCGRKFKASKLKQRWDGLMTCQQDWETRQPQDFVRGVPDTQIVPWIRDEPTDRFTVLNLWNTIFLQVVTTATLVARKVIANLQLTSLVFSISILLINLLRNNTKSVNGSVLNNTTIG